MKVSLALEIAYIMLLIVLATDLSMVCPTRDKLLKFCCCTFVGASLTASAKLFSPSNSMLLGWQSRAGLRLLSI